MLKPVLKVSQLFTCKASTAAFSDAAAVSLNYSLLTAKAEVNEVYEITGLSCNVDLFRQQTASKLKRALVTRSFSRPPSASLLRNHLNSCVNTEALSKSRQQLWLRRNPTAIKPELPSIREHTIADTLLADVCPLIGINLYFDDNRICSWRANNKYWVTLRGLGENSILLYGILGKYPELATDNFASKLLSINHRFAKVNKPYVGFDRSTDTLFLLKSITLDGLDAETLKKEIFVMLKTQSRAAEIFSSYGVTLDFEAFNRSVEESKALESLVPEPVVKLDLNFIKHKPPAFNVNKIYENVYTSAGALLAEYGKLIGIPNDKGLCSFVVDDKYTVTLKVNGKGFIVLCGILGWYPGRESDNVALELLNENCIYAKVNGPYVCFKPSSRKLFLRMKVPIVGFDVKDLKDQLDYLVKCQKNIITNLYARGITLGKENRNTS